ncbi:MAG: M23 family metallopeptidase [Spirochaetaceae bacterium]|jgi:murein DD-endopeptidase MepM/ murein hydrolase activator NlpD|nr:M23 family metallopeptidase [Spirochaetaceae bacterium]
MTNRAYRTILPVLCALLAGGPLVSQEAGEGSAAIPVIESLTFRDKAFMDFLKDLEAAYRMTARREDFTPVFYEYTPSDKDDFISLNARFSTPASALATVNRIETADESLAGRTLLIPASPGLFAAEHPETALEYLIAQRYSNTGQKNLKKILVKNMIFWYNPLDTLSVEERSFFFDPSMKLPLKDVLVSSPFGDRQSPITGQWQRHNGVDLAAPEGTPVLACKGGAVEEAGSDDTLGNYVIIEHPGAVKSLYAHLSKIAVSRGDRVKTGAVIGEVGETGAATGPHLHFEIRINGQAQDPKGSVKGL